MERPLYSTRRLHSVMSLFAALAAAAASTRSIVRVPLPMLSRSKREGLKSGSVGHSQTWFSPEKRNGARECARRMRQMANGTHGYPRAD